MDMLEYQHWTRRTRKYGDEWSVYYPTMELAAEAGEIANLVKKIPRDDDNVLTADRRDKIAKESGDVLWALARLLDDCQLELGDIAQLNIDKLEARLKQGTIQGSGDDR